MLEQGFQQLVLFFEPIEFAHYATFTLPPGRELCVARCPGRLCAAHYVLLNPSAQCLRARSTVGEFSRVGHR